MPKELLAMNRLDGLLQELTFEEQSRVIEYLSRRLDERREGQSPAGKKPFEETPLLDE